MKNFNLKIVIVHLLISFAASFALHYLSNLSFMVCFLIVEFALLLNGFMAGAGGVK